MDITRKRGDTYADRFTVTLGSSKNAVNLTGCTFKLTLSSVSAPIDASTQIYQIVGDITDPVNGVVEFSPSSAQADHVGVFYFDIQMTDTYGKDRTLDSGTYTYIQDITK